MVVIKILTINFSFLYFSSFKKLKIFIIKLKKKILEKNIEFLLGGLPIIKYLIFYVLNSIFFIY